MGPSAIDRGVARARRRAPRARRRTRPGPGGRRSRRRAPRGPLPSATMNSPVPISPWRAIDPVGGELDLDGRLRHRGEAVARRGRRTGDRRRSALSRSGRGEGHGSSWRWLGRHRAPRRRPASTARGTALTWRLPRWSGVCDHARGGDSRAAPAGETRRHRGHARGARRHPRRVRAVRGSRHAPAAGRGGAVRGGRCRGRRADPAPGPDRLRLLRHPRGHGGRLHRRHHPRHPAPRRLLRRGLHPAGRAAHGRRRRRPRRCAASCSGRRRSSRSCSPIPRSCSGCCRRRPGACATPTAGGASRGRRRAPLPAGRVPGRRHRLGARRAAALLRPAPPRRASTRSCPPTTARAACSCAGRSSSACSRGPSPTRRPSAAPASTSATTGTASSPTSPELRSLQAEFMDGTSYFPSRPEMQQNLEAFAERAGIARPLRHPLGADPARGGARRARPSCVETTTGEYRCRILVLAVGIAQPSSPATPGIELARHYAETRDAASYAGKRVFIIGKQNSGFELAIGPRRRGRRRSPSARRRRPRPASRPSRWSASGRATSSRSRTRSWASACGSSTRRSPGSRPSTAGSAWTSSAPTPASRCASRPTRSSPRPASPARCRTCRSWASRPSAPAGCPS